MRYKIALLAFAIGLLTGCEIVRPGYAGIKVNNYGSSRGVEDYPVQVGRVFYNPVSEDIYKYPTFVQTVRYDGEQHSLTFASAEGSALNVDVGISYSFVADKVPHVFVKYRQDPEHIEQTILRNNVRDALNRHASTMKAVDIVGQGKQALLDRGGCTGGSEQELGPEPDTRAYRIRASQGMERPATAILWWWRHPHVQCDPREEVNSLLGKAERSNEC